jgi:5'-nucleotidase
MKILLTNDDGYRAPGILALYHDLCRDHEVVLVAPDRERSAIGHGITLNQPLRVDTVDLNGGGRGFAVAGTPADCVKLGLSQLCGSRPDLVISGINAGSNTGLNINYSGTAGAAREGCLNRLPALAVSIQYGEVMDFTGMADFVGGTILRLAGLDLPRGVFLNINGPAIPMDQVSRVRITSQANNNFSDTMDSREDPRGNPYFWYGSITPVPPDRGTDEHALDMGCISITPIQCDMTAYGVMDHLTDVLTGG